MRSVARAVQRPGMVIMLAFAAAIAVGTALLSLPLATESGERAPFIDALFTATSAICVTGLVTVSTGEFWSSFGEVVLMVLFQAGGLGIMTLATLVAVIFFRRMGLATRMAVQVESKSISAADIRGILKRIFLFSIAVESVVALALGIRFKTGHGYGWGESAYYGAFHAIAAFNSAGFALFNDSFTSFVHDPLILMPLALAVLIGGTGFPVVFELVRSWRHPRSWSLLTRVTVALTVSLLMMATIAFFIVEIGNERTLGQVAPPQAIVVAFFTAVMPRSGGLNAIDIAAMTPESNFLTDLLMFIGGGSAGTAGGIKVTTLGILAYVVFAELKGRTDVVIGRRRIATDVQRQALVIVVFSASVVGAFTFLLMAITPFGFERVLFEVISAFGTVGLSMGITPELSTTAKAIIVGLMFVGRIGPLTLASALAARERRALTRVPEERIIIG